MTRLKTRYEAEAEYIGALLIASGGERRQFHAALEDYLEKRDAKQNVDDVRHSKAYTEGYSQGTLDAAHNTTVEIIMRVNGQDFEPMMIDQNPEGEGYRLANFEPCAEEWSLDEEQGLVTAAESNSKIGGGIPPKGPPAGVAAAADEPRSNGRKDLGDALADLEAACETFRSSTGFAAQLFVGPTQESIRFGIRACADAINQIEPEGHA